VGVLGPLDVLEGDASDLVREQPRARIERQQSRMLDFVVAEHLLHEQQRVRPHVNSRVSVRASPFQRSEESAVFRHVVRRRADRSVELLDERTVRALDADAEPGGAGVAARAAIDVRDDAAVRVRGFAGSRVPGFWSSQVRGFRGSQVRGSRFAAWPASCGVVFGTK